MKLQNTARFTTAAVTNYTELYNKKIRYIRINIHQSRSYRLRHFRHPSRRLYSCLLLHRLQQRRQHSVDSGHLLHRPSAFRPIAASVSPHADLWLQTADGLRVKPRHVLVRPAVDHEVVPQCCVISAKRLKQRSDVQILCLCHCHQALCLLLLGVKLCFRLILPSETRGL